MSAKYTRESKAFMWNFWLNLPFGGIVGIFEGRGDVLLNYGVSRKYRSRCRIFRALLRMFRTDLLHLLRKCRALLRNCMALLRNFRALLLNCILF